MIVTEGGKNIYPEDIEAAFEDIDGIEESCVFAANYIWPTGKMTGEELIVVLFPEDDAIPAEAIDELRRRNAKLADFKRVTGYVVVGEEFPRTASLKVKRNVLAERLGQLERVSTVVGLEA
jgi:long-chain acyl-CoA synthetase